MPRWLRFPDWPLRAKMAALLVAASLLPLAFWAWVDLRQDQARQLEGVKDLLEARGDQIVRELDSFHRGYQRAVNRLARFPDTRAFCTAPPAQRAPRQQAALLGVLSAYPASDEGIRGAAIIDAGGRVAVATEPSLIGVDLSDRPLAREALSGRAVTTNLFISSPASGSVPTIGYFAPVLDGEQRVVCVAVLWLRAAALWKAVKASNALAGPDSFAVLIDRDGIRVAHTFSDDIVFRPAGRLDPALVDRLAAERRFGARTRAWLEDVRPFPELFERARASSPDLAVFRGVAPLTGAWSYGVARRFESLPWTVFYMLPEAVIEAQMAQATRTRVLVAAAVLAAAGFIGLAFAATILRPIRALDTAAASIAGGDLAARVEGVRGDELGRFGASFNAMAGQVQSHALDLRRSRDQLEQRVRERTAELELEITRRAQVESVLRERDAALHRAHVMAKIAHVITGRDGVFEAWSETLPPMIGVLPAQMPHSTREWMQLLHEQDRETFRSTSIAAAVSGTRKDVEYRLRRADGAWIHVRQVIEPIPDADADAPDAEGHEPARPPEGLIPERAARRYSSEPAGPPQGRMAQGPDGAARRPSHGRWFNTLQDVSEQQQAEEERRAGEEGTRLIVETALDAVVTMDAAGLITGWSPQAERTFGWTRAQVLGRRLAETIIPAPQREAHERGLARYLGSGEAVVLNRRLELTALHRDGHEFPVEIAITPLRTAGTVAFSAFVRDISERKLAQARVQAQLERLQLLDQITRAIGERQDLESIYQVTIRSLEERLPVDFTCVCRHDGADEALTIVRVGAHSQGLAMELALGEQARIGIDRNGLSRCLQGELVHEPDIEASAFPFPQRLARGGLRSLVFAPLQSESHVFGILVAARRAPHAFSSGECEFLRQLSTHVALAARHAELHGALQQAYDELRQSQQTVMQQERLRALGQMASGIAHDINNAISPVALYTENLLEREASLSERGRGQLVTIARAVDDVAATVARMREFYRQREPQMQPVPVPLNALVQQVVDLTRARWSDMPQQRGIVVALETDLDGDLPAVLGVESELREALINLVFNAVDAMPAGGRLTLRTRAVPSAADGPAAPPRRTVQLDVCDTGVGMDEDTRRRCLEPFFTTKGERGTGLGLAMVYGVAQRHGVEVEIDSVVGQGTTVRLDFPVPELAPAAAVAAPAPQAPVSRLRILIVDDDPLMLKSLGDTLESDGHVVVTANGGQAGIDAFTVARRPGETFDVVITDLGMPYVDGRSVAAVVKASASATPVILLTGWGQRLLAEGDVPAQVDQVLSKPPKLRELRAALARLTAGDAAAGTSA
ncbi:MAG: PAS domain S-box protein [Burkholderiales bacterium]|nr:PAS domain S-box protein [Burkholderiales bacterium]